MYLDDADQDSTPIKVAGDGNCLYRAISILMCGNENQHLELRLRCVLELAQNPEYYAQECFSFALEATDSGKQTSVCQPYSVLVCRLDQPLTYFIPQQNTAV